MSKSSSGLSMGLIPAFLPPMKAAGKWLLCPHKDLGPHSAAHRCWAQATEGGSCPTCGTFGTPCSGVMCVQGAQQAPDQIGWAWRKHRRLRKAPYGPVFLLWASACSLCETWDRGGWTHLLLREYRVLVMLRREEIQLPLPIVVFRQGTSSCLTCLPKSRTRHQTQRSRGISCYVSMTQTGGTERQTDADP